MKNKKYIALAVIIIIIIIIGIFVIINILNQEGNSNKDLQSSENQKQIDITGNSQESTQTDAANTTQNLNEESDNMNNQNEDIKINLIVKNKTFSATLNNNETVKQLIEMFPMTLNMSDLHSNEKYNYLDTNLTTNSSRPNRINAGDIKLYGNNCLVVFYEDFSNSYSYTDLGRVDDVDAFVSELGRGNVTVTFELDN